MHTTVAIVGGGPAGLAMSRCLADRAVDHVVLERGQIANSWRTERWDSLRLLTPNWMLRLPGHGYDGADPDGYMTAAAATQWLSTYAGSFDAPVLQNAAVTALRRPADGFVLDSPHGPLRARAVVIATGAHGVPTVPTFASSIPSPVHQVHTLRYRRPDQVGMGGVLVVGASASGVQIADELRRHGRPVTIAVGDHVRLPRSYRGRDIYWWMNTLGLLGEGYTEVDDLARARRVPSAQLVGTPERRTLGLSELQTAGVRVVGRLAGVTDRRAQFSGSLANFLRSADLKQARLLDRIDSMCGDGPAERPAPTPVPSPVTELSWSEFDTVIWATGYRPDHGWLDPSLLDRRGRIEHDGGVMPAPGMYVLGLPFLRRRSSTFIHGLEADAVELARHLVGFLGARRSAA